VTITPQIREEDIAFLAYSFHRRGVDIRILKRMTCCHCFHEYQQSIQETVLRPKTQAEIDPAGGEHTLCLDLRKSAQPGRVWVPFGALHARRTERCTPASNYALPRGGVAVWDAIEPDEALLVAVARLSTGADVHKLLWLASRYRWACEHGFQMLASEIEQKIRRELAKNVQTALARQR
jgi:hypothetical protein